MYNITFISTIHEERGKCNADELCKIIEQIKPEVIFLEALEETYSAYDKQRFSSFGVYHKQLEIAAIQKYLLNNSIEYVPVLDYGLSGNFDNKYNIVGQNHSPQKLLYMVNHLIHEHGFNFLNSLKSLGLQEEMRIEELRILNNNELGKQVDADIDKYENSMLRNIYSFCKKNQFNSAIFMCGVAHRKSIIEKMEKLKAKEGVNLNWILYEN